MSGLFEKVYNIRMYNLIKKSSIHNVDADNKPHHKAKNTTFQMKYITFFGKVPLPLITFYRTLNQLVMRAESMTWQPAGCSNSSQPD